MGTRIRLSVMMFLQYFVFGIWLPMIALRMGAEPGGLDFSVREKGWIFTVYGFGAIIGPFIVGQLADRYFSTERVLAFCHLVGGLLLIATAYVTTFWPFFILLFLYCNLYMPSMGLTNSITFRNMGEAAFPGVRVWGTIGWIAAGNFFAFYLAAGDSAAFKAIFNAIGKPEYRDCLRVAGVSSLVYGVYCFALPHTPPTPANASDPVDKKSATMESLELLKDRSFFILTAVAAVIGIMLAFYFACENDFLAAIGTPPTKIGQYMTIGQVAEMVVMVFVPYAVSTFGYKKTMILGASAWALRFGFSVLGTPWWLMIATIGLHGFCFGFFFVVAQMFVDSKASADIKASAQNLLIFLIYGIGTIVGSLLTGEVRTYFSEGGKENWSMVWAGPFVLTILCILAFAALFREKPITKPLVSGDPLLA